MDGPPESSAEYGSRTSSTSLTKLENILDDNGEGTKRVEEMKRQQTSDTTLELHPFYGSHYEDVAAIIGGGQPK
ncbi:hypothetical protein RB195_009818 [Necator americanus]|uniref:CTNNB1 binding N-teminal domain-containing protein n=1 Tax=Necator americanus TaxID=51031 RepID=A0ABR1CWX5_NECAM